MYHWPSSSQRESGPRTSPDAYQHLDISNDKRPEEMNVGLSCQSDSYYALEENFYETEDDEKDEFLINQQQQEISTRNEDSFDLEDHINRRIEQEIRSDVSLLVSYDDATFQHDSAIAKKDNSIFVKNADTPSHFGGANASRNFGNNNSFVNHVLASQNFPKSGNTGPVSNSYATKFSRPNLNATKIQRNAHEKTTEEASRIVDRNNFSQNVHSASINVNTSNNDHNTSIVSNHCVKSVANSIDKNYSRNDETIVCDDNDASFLEIPCVTPGGSGTGRTSQFKSVAQIPAPYDKIFRGSFPYFNLVQSTVFEDVFHGDKSLVVSAPTGSGKTVIFELAIIRELLLRKGKSVSVYVAPIKALCSERFFDWTKRFSLPEDSKKFPSVKCLELTGDSFTEDRELWNLESKLKDHNLILTTPEKWDIVTRGWNRSDISLNKISGLIRLVMLDEVHLLNDQSRGHTLEAVVTRMKTTLGQQVRFVAVSATIPNCQDISVWLGNNRSLPNDGGSNSTHHEFGEERRPVPLRRVVLGFPFDGKSFFKFEMNLTYRVSNVISTYSEDKPTLVFCNSRKSAQSTATVLVKELKHYLSSRMNASSRLRLEESARIISNESSDHNKLRECIAVGIGFHHAGLASEDRNLIENLFRSSYLRVLVSTTTLALGVNLPAHLVIIKSTTHMIAGAYQELEESQILQMIGRAGRPQFDSSATAVIMTSFQQKSFYEELTSGTRAIESGLCNHLEEHLNAEIVMNTITDVSVAMDWIRATFLYVRMMKSPDKYVKIVGRERSPEGMERKLEELCMRALNGLAKAGLVKMDDSMALTSNEAGRLMARFYMAYETMKNFNELVREKKENGIDMKALLKVLCESKELQDSIQLRRNEKSSLNLLNGSDGRKTMSASDRPIVRFPIKAKVKDVSNKINVLVQAQLGCLHIAGEPNLIREGQRLLQVGQRVARCLSEYVWCSDAPYSTLKSALLLAKCLRAGLWEDSPYVSKQFEGVGLSYSTSLVHAGLTSMSSIAAKNAREIEMIINRPAPFGNRIKDSAAHVPMYKIEIRAQDEGETRRLSKTLTVTIEISLENLSDVRERSTAGKYHSFYLLAGNTVTGDTYMKARLKDSLLFGGPLERQFTVVLSLDPTKNQIEVGVISDKMVGIDLFRPVQQLMNGERTSQGLGLTPSPRTPVAKVKPIVLKQTQRIESAAAHDCATPRTTLKNSKNVSATPMRQTFLDSSTLALRKPCDLHNCFDRQRCGHSCCKNGRLISPPPAKKITQMNSNDGLQKVCNNTQVQKIDDARSKKTDKPLGFSSLLQQKKTLFCQETELNKDFQQDCEKTRTTENTDNLPNFCADFQLDYDEEIDDMVSIQETNSKAFEQNQFPTFSYVPNIYLDEARSSPDRSSAIYQRFQPEHDQSKYAEKSSNRFQSFATPNKKHIDNDQRATNRLQIQSTPNRPVQTISFSPLSLSKELQKNASHSETRNQSNFFHQSTADNNSTFDKTENNFYNIDQATKDSQYKLDKETFSESGQQDPNDGSNQHSSHFLKNFTNNFHIQNQSHSFEQAPSMQESISSHSTQIAHMRSILNKREFEPALPHFNPSASNTAARRDSNNAENAGFEHSSSTSLDQAKVEGSFSNCKDLQSQNSSQRQLSSERLNKEFCQYQGPNGDGPSKSPSPKRLRSILKNTGSQRVSWQIEPCSNSSSFDLPRISVVKTNNSKPVKSRISSKKQDVSNWLAAQGHLFTLRPPLPLQSLRQETEKSAQNWTEPVTNPVETGSKRVSKSITELTPFSDDAQDKRLAKKGSVEKVGKIFFEKTSQSEKMESQVENVTSQDEDWIREKKKREEDLLNSSLKYFQEKLTPRSSQLKNPVIGLEASNNDHLNQSHSQNHCEAPKFSRLTQIYGQRKSSDQLPFAGKICHSVPQNQPLWDGQEILHGQIQPAAQNQIWQQTPKFQETPSRLVTSSTPNWLGQRIDPPSLSEESWLHKKPDSVPDADQRRMTLSRSLEQKLDPKSVNLGKRLSNTHPFAWLSSPRVAKRKSTNNVNLASCEASHVTEPADDFVTTAINKFLSNNSGGRRLSLDRQQLTQKQDIFKI